MSDIDNCLESVKRLTRDRGEVMRAGSDKIAEIRARHAMYPPSRPSSSSRYSFIVAYQDIATLLAEDERHRAEIERLTRERDEARAEVTRMQELLRGISINMVDLIEQLTRERDAARAENDRHRAENERLHKEADLTREALGGWALVPPDGGADPTHECVAAVVAEVARMKKLHAPPADLPWPSREEGKP